MRALLGIGGVVTALLCLPVARASFETQRADSVIAALREARPVTPEAVRAAMDAHNRAVAAEPSPGRLFRRSEFLAAAALSSQLKTQEPDQSAWLKQAKADLLRGLAKDPVRPNEWLSLASVTQALDGASREVVPYLLMSIRTGRTLSHLWPARMRLILSNWGYFSDEEKKFLNDYVVMTWRLSSERWWWGRLVYDVFDEVIIRWLLRDEPMSAQEELSKWIKQART